MALFVTSIAAIGAAHGVYAVERPPPSIILPAGTGRAGIVGQFSWGPVQIETGPDLNADRTQKFQPLGMSRANSAWLMLKSTSYPELCVVRVLGVGAVAATATVNKTGPTPMLTVTLKFPGSQGDNVVASVMDASDGDPNHFQLQVTVSNAEGTTTDIIDNINFSGVGADSVIDFTNAVLIGGITKLAAGSPTRGQVTFSGGTDGAAITANDYVGTQGSTDKGISLFEGDPLMRHVYVDDCGNSLRAAVNAGLEAHANYLLDRTVYLSGNSGLSSAGAITDANSYESTNVVYVDPWVYVFDDLGNRQQIPPACFGASLGASVSPSTSFAWRDDSVRRLLSAIQGVVSNRLAQAPQQTLQGISTIVPYSKGGYCFYAAKVTIAPANPAKANWTRTQMGIYIASSVTASLQSDVDAPNVPVNQNDVVTAIDEFLDQLVANKDENPNTAPYILGYTKVPTSDSNTQFSLDSGNFIVERNIKIGSSMERIIFSVQFGETVQITAS